MKTKLISFFLLMGTVVFSQEILPSTDTIILGIGQVFDIKVQSNYAYCLTETGFYRLNTSNPSNITVAGYLAIPEGANKMSKIVLYNNRAYIGNGTAGVCIVNISNLSSLNLVSNIQGIGNISELAIKANVLYALNYNSDIIKIINITNPASPVVSNTINSSGSWYSEVSAIEAIGDYLFCMGRYSRIWRWNISNPLNPVAMAFMDEYWTGDYVQSFFEATSNLLYVEDDDAHINVYQVTPSTGQLSRFYKPNIYGESSISRFFVYENYLYISSWGSSRIFIWDKSNLANPVLIDHIEPSQNDFQSGYAINILDGNCFIGASGQVLKFPLLATTPSGRFDKRGYYNDIKKKGSYLYTACGSNGLIIYSVLNRQHPAQVAQVIFPVGVERLYVDPNSNYLYCIANGTVENNKVYIVNISNPASPVTVSNFSVPWKYPNSNQYCYVRDLVVKGNYAYAFFNYPTGYTMPEYNEFGVAVYNISSITNPALTGKFSTMSWNVSAMLIGDNIYTVERRYFAEAPGGYWTYTGWNGIVKYSVVNPVNPVVVQSQNFTDYPIDFSQKDTLFYVLTGQILNYSEASAITVKYINKNTLSIQQTKPLTDTPEFIYADNDFLFTTNHNREFNINNRNITFAAIDSNRFQFSTGHFTFDDPYVYMCNGYALTTFPINFSPLVPQLSLNNITIGSGISKCYNATQTITVAGNGTSFLIQNGGNATLIAGQKILFKPGASVKNGGHMHARITNTGSYCVTLPASLIHAQILEMATAKDDFANSNLIGVYPNPTTGKFKLRLNNKEISGTVVVRVFTIFGNEIENFESADLNTFDFTLSDQPDGIYLISVLMGSQIITEKIIKY